MPQARMTRSDIIDAVREITEMDSNDVSDSIIDIYIRDGYNRIIDLERRWSFLECSFNVTTVANQEDYTVDDFTADEIREVIAVVDDENNRLEYVAYDTAEDAIIDSNLNTGVPTFYSFWGGKMYLFPTPKDASVLSVRAYRYPTDWVTNDTAPDGVVSFDMALVYYAISRIYQAQEELNTAATYERMYADTVTLARRDLTRPPSSAPVVFAGGKNLRMLKGKSGYGYYW